MDLKGEFTEMFKLKKSSGKGITVKWIIGFGNMPMKTKVFISKGGIATLLVNLFALVIGFFVMVVYDRILPSNALTSLAGLFIGASVIIVLRYILELLKTYFLDFAGQSIEKNI